MPYGGGPLAFIQILEEWRMQGEFKGLELDRVSAAEKENT